ncbi:TonB-dependent hemoglobin/transferrin/lactoferrin family receptor [Solimicrobium silvestre]|uniref:TonB-hemlactrns: TonB-dependent hemoglobin/transferrin/lactoferrin receptor family protein n=1 Tax=Solimicrobium silvestre TaxID=2099400 RepID=A0A2S9H0W2_9BURK|nr:TonB-dependent hemoglobin/transferrin/lactoferrin family receptor [Solimicrobium silvestre]PRC93624.1 TonB-hemlactrns: TonB-dependent hemoglobin/transferrin/lactoferrin receptor family protein [Solimicrobium silvestre]
MAFLHQSSVAVAVTLALQRLANAEQLADPIPLDEITVTATRSASDVNKVAATVTVLPSEKLDTGLVHDIKDLERLDLGISIRQAPTRFGASFGSTGRAGNEGINIRGLEGNQILLQVDGIRLPNAYSFGPQSTGRGDYLDMDSLKTVEILRGSSSSLYGSDGLAGAVSFITKDPEDYFDSADKNTYFSVKNAFNSLDNSWGLTGTAALRNDQLQALLLLSHKQGNETKNMGDRDAPNFTRDQPNPQDKKSDYALAKLVFNIDAQQRIKLTAESLRRDSDTNVLTARLAPPPPASDNTLIVPPLRPNTVLDLQAADNLQRDRFSLNYIYEENNNPWWQTVDLNAYHQSSENQQASFETRNTAANRIRDNSYSQDTTGISAQFNSKLGQQQQLIYGADWSRANISSLRDGTVPGNGETFPTKAFPDTTYSLFGAFLQDEIQVGNWNITPALRYDKYTLTPHTDGQYKISSAASNGNSFSPKLGVVYQAQPGLNLFAQYGHGFRAPTPEMVNNGFSNPAHGYVTISNPNLKPEASNNFELGLRGQTGTLRYSVSAFIGRYSDFIRQTIVSGAGTPTNPTVYQYVNMDKAQIHGMEARAKWEVNPKLNVLAGLAITRGSLEQNGISNPLDTVDPAKLNLGINYQFSDAWSSNATLTHVAAKSASQSEFGNRDFLPGSYQVFDLSTQYRFNKNLSVNAGIFNLFNHKYYQWSDVRGIAANSVFKDAYSAPGRNVSLNITYQF